MTRNVSCAVRKCQEVYIAINVHMYRCYIVYTACIGMYVAIQCFVYWILHESELVELKLEQPDHLHIAMYIHMFASAYVCNYTRLEPIMLLKLPIMLLKFPIMLLRNAPKSSLLCSANKIMLIDTVKFS